MDEGYSSFSDSSYESHGGGWSLSGSVSAGSSSASASMGPSINNPTAFNGPYGIRVADYTGGANVEASREKVTVWVPYIYSPYLVGTLVTFKEKADYGNGSFLQAWVLMVEKEVEEVNGRQVSDPTITLKIEVPLGDNRAEVGAEWNSGGQTYKTETHTRIKKIVPQEQPSQSINAYVSGHEDASKSAGVSYFYFDGNDYVPANAAY